MNIFKSHKHAAPKESETHFVLGTPLHIPPDSSSKYEFLMVGMGCFWGAEKTFWKLNGPVYSTAVGYSGGHVENPTYDQVCSGTTGHAEVVRIAFDPHLVSFESLLKAFWEGHDPTQLNKQGNDHGTQYRSAIFYYSDAQREKIEEFKNGYERELIGKGFGRIQTTIEKAGPFYFAEGYHQQYLAKNPHGYCGHGGTGVSCPMPIQK